MSSCKQMETLEAFDGIELYCETFASPQPKGVIIALHDYAEHCGLYDGIFERMARESYHVYAMDLRGHGKSPGDRAFIANFDYFLEDLDLFLARVRDREAELAAHIFLLGQGLGATIAARFALTRKPRVRGLILCSPLLDLPLSRMERTLALVPGGLFPHAPVSGQVQTSWLEPKLRGILKDDQLAFRGPLQLNTVREILAACHDLRTGEQHLPFPLLTMVGGEVKGDQTHLTRELQETVLSSDKTLLTYEDMDDNVLLHRERDQVVGDIIEWCDRVVLEEQSALAVEEDEEDEDDRL